MHAKNRWISSKWDPVHRICHRTPYAKPPAATNKLFQTPASFHPGFAAFQIFPLFRRTSRPLGTSSADWKSKSDRGSSFPMLKSSGINTADGSIRSNIELVVSNFAVKIALASGQSERAAGIKIGRRFWIRSESVCNPDWQSSNPRSTRCPRNGRKERRENGSEEPRPPAADWFISIAFSLRSFAASTSRSGIQLKRDGDALPFSFFFYSLSLGREARMRKHA